MVNYAFCSYHFWIFAVNYHLHGADSRVKMEFLGYTLDVTGKVMVAYMAIRVHHRFWKEHQVDEKVFSEMKREKKIGIMGIVFIILCYLLQIPSKFC